MAKVAIRCEEVHLRECMKCDDDDGPKGGAIPRWIDEMVSRPIPPPVYPRANPLAYVPGSDGLWQGIGTGSLIIGGGAAIAVGIIIAPEITIPVLRPAF